MESIKDDDVDKIGGQTDVRKSRQEHIRWVEELKSEISDIARGERVRAILEEQFHSILHVTKYLIPISISALVWHFVLPEWLGWLTDSQVDGIKWILLGGLGVGSISAFAYRYLPNQIVKPK